MEKPGEGHFAPKFPLDICAQQAHTAGNVTGNTTDKITDNTLRSLIFDPVTISIVPHVHSQEDQTA